MLVKLVMHRSRSRTVHADLPAREEDSQVADAFFSAANGRFQ